MDFTAQKLADDPLPIRIRVVLHNTQMSVLHVFRPGVQVIIP